MHRQQIQMLKSKKEVCPLDAGEAKLLLSRSIAKGPRQHTSSLNESSFRRSIQAAIQNSGQLSLDGS